jgi:hypothetical protein
MAAEEDDFTTPRFDIFTIDDEHEGAIQKVIEDRSMKDNLPLPFLESSPFKALSSANRSVGQNVIFENQFATVIIEGEELDVSDEDVLLSILASKQEKHDDNFNFVTSLNEIIKKIGATWRGKKKEKNSLSTSEEIIESLKRLKKSTITMHRKKEQRTLMFEIIDFLDIPFTTKDGKLLPNFKVGKKDQIKISLSKQFFYFYSEYKTYKIKLDDRILIKDNLGKAIQRYTRYLTSFQKTGLHRERLELLITKVNWQLPTQEKNGKTYIRWAYVKNHLNNAKKGLEKVGITLVIPDKLNLDAIIEIKSLSQTEMDIK